MLYIVDWVKIRRIRRPHCWRNEVEYLSLQESDGVACSMRQGAVLSKDKNPPWDIQNMYGSCFWARGLSRYSLCPIHFDSIIGFQCCHVWNADLRYLVLLCLTRKCGEISWV